MINFGIGSNNTSTTSASTGTPNFSFGSNSTQATSASGGGFQLGQPVSQPQTSAGFGTVGGLNFGSSTTTPNPLLAGTSSTAATTSTSFTGFGLIGQAALGTSSASGFSLGNPATTTTASGLGGFTFGGQTNTATSTASLGGISFGSASVSSAPAASNAAAPFSFGGLGGAAVTSSTGSLSLGLGGAPSLGLGGAQPPATSVAGEAAGSSAEGRSCKETPLPQDIFVTIAAFESFKSQEKAASEANLQQSATAFLKLGEDCVKLRSLVTQLSTAQAGLQQRVNQLKDKIVASSEDVEMTRRTHATPTHLQGDNTAPELYFSKVLDEFELHMTSCRDRIEEVEKCLALTGQTLDSNTAVRELVRRQHDNLQVAAAHVYRVHAKLVQLNALLPCPDHLKPQPLFRAGVGDLSKLDDNSCRSAVPEQSGVVRNCFEVSGGTSRLGAYQLSAARARALSLNPAPPPTQGLSTQSSLFGNLGAPNNFGSLNFGGGLGSTGGASAFGNIGASAFGNTGTSAFGNTGTSAFGNTGTSAFGNTGTSAFGNSGTSAFGNTGTSAFGNTSNSAFGNTGTSAFGNTGSSAFGNTGSSAFGNTGTSAFGNTGTSAFGSPNNSAFGNTGTSAFGNTTSPTFGNTCASAFGNTSTTQAGGSLFSSPFGQSNKLFKS